MDSVSVVYLSIMHDSAFEVERALVELAHSQKQILTVHKMVLFALALTHSPSARHTVDETARKSIQL